MDTARALAGISKIISLQQREECEQSLLAFSKYVWPVVEPAIDMVQGWALEAICDHLEAVERGDITRLLINVPPGFSKSLLSDVFFPAWIWGPRNRPWTRFLCAAYGEHLTVRDNMRCRNIIVSERYQKLWKGRFKVSGDQFTKINFANDKTGWKMATSVGGGVTGHRADIVIVDDPNNPMEMESEAIRESTKIWFTEILPDRLNNQEKSAIVIIQQRTHEEDVSGIAIAREMGYEHLMIPMYYDPGRHCTTTLGWSDPRSEEGDLAWSERFPLKVCEDLRRDKGPHAWCSSAEAPVLMADLSMKRIDEIKVGDEIVGFTTGVADKKARYKKAEVLSISKSVREIVKITLDSGETVRCTADHKWFTGRNDKTHPQYAPAYAPGANKRGRHDRGSKLIRVCPSRLPVLSREDERLAGWLSGFFDGEGTVSLNKRREGESASLIQFSQTAEKNLPLCEKLELALNTLGFSWSCMERQRIRSSQTGVLNQKNRLYYLRSDAGSGFTGKGTAARRASRFTLNQRFVHVVQPVKWRQRLIDSSLTGRMFTASERVVSIEPDGIGTVYGLETTTGNYVVWGLASSNSGQYQQSPEPRGGAIIKRDWWQNWKGEKYPPFEFVLASLDTAFTEKEENDACALTVWGVFREDASLPEDGLVGSEALWMRRDGRTAIRPREGNPKVMLIYAWQDRMEFYDLIEKVIATCIPNPANKGIPSFPVDKLLIEAKANGLSVGQELHRMFRGSGKFGLDLINPTQYGDKVARVHAVQHLFADNMIYAPDRAFADLVINQCAVFPRGARDDLVDTVSMALRYLRDAGFALRREEQALVAQEELEYTPSSARQSLYPC